jgi:hypothetical protein
MVALVKAIISYVDGSGNIVPASANESGNVPIIVEQGTGPTAGTITSVNGAATSTTILAANTSRKGATITNDSTAILYLALSDTTASATVYSIKLSPDDYYELPVTEAGVYTGKIVGIWASATGAARVTELT